MEDIKDVEDHSISKLRETLMDIKSEAQFKSEIAPMPVDEHINVVEDEKPKQMGMLKPGVEYDIDPEHKLPENVREMVREKLMSGELTSDEVAMQERIKNMSNKRKFKLGILPNGYKAGFTKPTVKKKTTDRRKKNKVARASRKANR